MPDPGCAFCWPLTPRGRIVLGPRIGICEGCADDIQNALRSPPVSAEPIPGHRPAPSANGHQAAFPVARSASGIPGSPAMPVRSATASRWSAAAPARPASAAAKPAGAHDGEEWQGGYLDLFPERVNVRLHDPGTVVLSGQERQFQPTANIQEFGRGITSRCPPPPLIHEINRIKADKPINKVRVLFRNAARNQPAENHKTDANYTA